jgi:hypothetical protein
MHRCLNLFLEVGQGQLAHQYPPAVCRITRVNEYEYEREFFHSLLKRFRLGGFIEVRVSSSGGSEVISSP